MKKHNFKDKKLRLSINGHESERIALKTLQNIGVRNSSGLSIGSKGISSTRNRCVLTGRSRGLSLQAHLKMSRLMIRELASKGLIPGLKKAS